MKRFSPFKTLMAAGIVAGLMGSAASAGMADYKQMLDSVRSGLDSLHVDTSQLELLTVGQLGQLTGILDSDLNNDSKALRANTLIDQAIMPTTLDMNSEEGKRLKKELKVHLDRVGLVYPVDKMNIDQVNHLLAAFNRFKTNDENAKQAAEGIFAGMVSPDHTVEASSNLGLVQQQEQINAKLAALGITPPASLNQEQVAKLTDILNNKEPEANQKAAAMTVLGM